MSNYVTVWMAAFLTGIRKKVVKQQGQTWMEYGMIIGGVILVIVLVIALFGDKMLSLFQNITNAISVRDPNGGGSGGW